MTQHVQAKVAEIFDFTQNSDVHKVLNEMAKVALGLRVRLRMG